MEIKPRYNTQTLEIRTTPKRVSLGSKTKKIVKDPSGDIPNGIYNVINWEKLMIIVSLSISIIIFMANLGLIGFFALYLKVKPGGYIVPAIIFLISGYKLISNLIRMSYLRKSVIRYREDIRIGINHTPPFLIKLYRDYHTKQVGHNWLTFFILLNGGIFTLLVWWLKDASWWIFKFDKWIHEIFNDPDFIIWVFASILIVTSIFHIYMAIQRKRKILAIDLYFGANIVPHSEISEEKTRLNKSYRRMFIIYVLVVFIIPLVAKFILKVISRRK